ncbi:MAG: putative toxin-antitoxin system toxin component, PIN family [Candidatus Humimicrobiaceae bacterium]
MKVVIDTNVFISSFFRSSVNPGKIIDLWKSGKITICISKEIFDEYFEVLIRLGLANEPELKELTDIFQRKENMIYLNMVSKINLKIDDEDDLKFIECALMCKADYIVSGDKHLQKLKKYKNINILSPGEFLAVIDKISGY